MKMMFWKEWRENLKWAFIGMIALTFAEFYSLLLGSNSSDDSSATLCRSSFLTVTTFGSAVVGIVLGLIQILPEQKRDQWAALLHRPVSRATIFRGKAIAGLALYFVATVPPFLASVWYAATPGNFAAPFVPQMTLPGIFGMLSGTMFYFAALFVGVRRGSWFGPRVFGLLAALVSSAFAASTYLSLAIGGPVLMAIVLFLAGWGAISTNGAFRDQPWFGRFATIVAIYFGAFFLVMFLISLPFLFLTQQQYYGGIGYNIDIDGRPLKFTSTKDNGTVITDLAGNPINDKRFTTGSNSTYLLSFAQVTSNIGDSGHGKKEQDDDDGGFDYSSNRSYVIPANGTYDNNHEAWYYLPLTNHFVGYYTKTRQRIGAIGKDGYRPGYEQVSPLANYKAGRVWEIPSISLFGSTVYHSDFDQRKLTPIFFEPGVTVFGATPMSSYQDRTIDLNWGAVALSDKMIVIDKTGQVLATLPYHQNVDRWGGLSVGVTPDKTRFYLRYSPSGWIDSREQFKMPSFCEEMDAKGNLLHSYTFPATAPVYPPDSWQGYVMESTLPPGVVFGYLAYVKVGALCGSEKLARNWDSMDREDSRNIMLFSSILSLLLAVVTAAWTRRLNFQSRRVWAWTAFVLVFNLAGFITFRLLADWPVRMKCPQCSRKRPVEESTCPYCQAIWPAPKPDGIEIFEKKSSTAELVS